MQRLGGLFAAQHQKNQIVLFDLLRAKILWPNSCKEKIRANLLKYAGINFRAPDLGGFKMIPICRLRLDLSQGI